MKKVILLGTFAFVLLTIATAQTSAPDSDMGQGDSPFCAEESALGTQCDSLAKAWLPLLDQGKYAECYASLIDAAKARQSLDNWVQTMQLYHRHEGALVSRELVFGTSLKAVMPGDPPTFSLQYETNFEKLKAEEEVQCVRDKDGKWKINAYSLLIRSAGGAHAMRPGEKWPDEN